MIPTRLVPHALAYAAYYTTVGVLLPYLSAYFQSRGFDATEIGLLLSFGPLFAAVTPIAVGYAADRLGRPRAIMRVALAGASLSMVALASTRSFSAAVAVMLVYAIFQPPVLVLLEAATLHELQARGGAYARVRMFGSIAFVVAAFGIGFFLDARVAERTAALAWVPRFAALALFAQLVTSLFLPAHGKVDRAVDPRAALRLLRIPGLVPLLVTATLHWIAMAPYHTLFAVHVHDLGLPDRVVGMSMALGASAEVLLMLFSPRLSFSPRTLLLAAYASGIVRWAASGLVTSGALLVAIQALHGLTFGAFYLAAIATLQKLIPSELRATGQGLFIAMVFGLGGALGTILAGTVAELGGGQAAFLTSAGVSLLLTLIWWRCPRELN